ncbi:putative sodium-coupled neutral amino acid transporter 10 [Amyelois transitella]|uniref:putative sodium-coupled neutral amino acid transporter 10 n=1 Tax=Amyelois transitella TaxID=680683 RepID=UPI00298F5988|nr:putative sodium-coupled neutral amino acid transporter 10 [Amyelois transitella]
MGTSGQSITLANSIIGVGILAMPFCYQQCGVLLATLILLFMGLVSRLCCYFLLKSALLARRRNFEFLAFHVFGPAGKLAVEIGIIGFLMGTCIAYFVVVGDLGPQIIAKLFNINQSDILRTSIMVLVSLLCVLPLGLLRNVDSLSNVSAATIGFYFCLVMKVIAEAASQLWSGEWQVHMELWKPSGVLQCVPIFSMALFCQTQLFEIFESLPTLSLEKMNLVTKNAINICTGVYFTLGVFGYIAFCSQQISGNILMSLSPTMASDVIKLGFVMSVAFSFPLIIFPCRASLYSLLYKKVHSSHHDHIINHSIPESSFRIITISIIAVTLFISLLIPNIELVLGLVGSTIGVMICIVFPAACFINVTFKNTNERVLAKGILVLGLIIMVLGTYANLQAAETQIDKYDERYITPEKIDKIVEEFFEKMDQSDDGILVKPIDKNDVKVDEDIKDSMALPPNPVPPDSNEKLTKSQESIREKLIDDPIKDKVSETHPKNLKKNNDVNLKNGDSNKIKINGESDKIDVIKPLEEKQVNEDKKEIEKKQQKLIETIKQHGEEQKELLKEQKVILDEILKAKKDMALKNEAEKNIEAKKIAVESIKKIADVALQRLAGVSEKPAEDKKDNVGKFADEAVQEIAKKAVETIQAIKEINEKTEIKAEEKAVPIQNIMPIPSQNVQQLAQNVPKNVPPPIPNNLQPIQNIPQAINNAPQVLQNSQSNQNMQQPAEFVQSVQSVNQPAQNIPPNENVPQSSVNAQQPAQNVQPVVQKVQQQAQGIPQPPESNAQQTWKDNVPANDQKNIPQPSSNAQQPTKDVHPNAQQQQAQNLLLPLEHSQQPANNVQSHQNLQQSAQQKLPLTGENIKQSVHQSEPQVVQNAPVNNLPQTAQNNKVQNAPMPVPNNQNQPVQNVQQPIQNVQPSQNGQQPLQSDQNVQMPANHEKILAQNVQQIPNSQQNIPIPANAQQPNVAQFVSNNLPKASVQNENVQPLNVQNNQKKHYHTEDEPKSYRQGEDAQNQDGANANIIQNNQNGNSIANNFQTNEKIERQVNNDEKPIHRKKRDAIDCTNKSALKPEDKEICKHVNMPEYNIGNVDLPEVDMNLPKNLPLYENLIHIRRSLKSYDDKENR